MSTVEIIKLNGSVELAPIVGLADVIVDIVETGTTLKENGLQVLEEICDLSARVVVNEVSMKMEHERITKIRLALKLTQKDFGSKIGLKPSTISDLERNRCGIIERAIISICSRFNVNEDWLRSGEGEMFISSNKYEEFFEIYKNLDPALQDYLLKCASFSIS